MLPTLSLRQQLLYGDSDDNDDDDLKLKYIYILHHNKSQTSLTELYSVTYLSLVICKVMF